ncbi:hypothetical protein L226DRAFT_611290, partial [Lentinus tigrinus ALCF2SS1-7]|uniref:uncharacterized protein n=1 Tax=Lentinus tigrinus ALCF2SS1-7 TaxID=1328758 RepID=UPI0011663841
MTWRAGGRADIHMLVRENGSSVPALGVSDRRKSVVKGITREKTGMLIKADGREDEREDDFEDGEDDVGKAREDSQIARCVPSAADRSLPPVGRERSGDGRGRLPDSADEQDSRAREKLKSTQDLEKLLNRKRHDPVLPSDASRRPGGQGQCFHFLPEGGTQSWRIPLRGPRDEYLPTRYPESKDIGQCAGVGNQNALQGLETARTASGSGGQARLKSKTHRKLKTKDDLARPGGINRSQQACSGTANRDFPPVGRRRSVVSLLSRGRDLGPGAYLSAVLGTSMGNQNALEGLVRAKIGFPGNYLPRRTEEQEARARRSWNGGRKTERRQQALQDAQYARGVADGS